MTSVKFKTWENISAKDVFKQIPVYIPRWEWETCSLKIGLKGGWDKKN